MFMKKKITLWTDEIEDMENLWNEFYKDFYDVEQTVDVKWNWKKFKYMFYSKLILKSPL